MGAFKLVDLFCGAGGMTKGFAQVGFDPVLAVDKDRWAVIWRIVRQIRFDWRFDTKNQKEASKLDPAHGTASFSGSIVSRSNVSST